LIVPQHKEKAMKANKRLALYALNELVGMFVGAFLALNAPLWFTWIAVAVSMLVVTALAFG
jgi:hypothetical protein